MTDDRRELIRRVRKLRERAIAERDTSEGRTAAALARQLMREHKITREELEPKPSRVDVPSRRDRRQADAPFRIDYEPGRSITLEAGPVKVRFRL